MENPKNGYKKALKEGIYAPQLRSPVVPVLPAAVRLWCVKSDTPRYTAEVC